MKNRPLTEILTEYKEVKKVADIVLETVPVKSRQAFMIGKRQAEDKMVELRREYRDQLLSNTVGFFLFGDKTKVEKFADVSHTENGTVQINANEMYEYLADQIAPGMGAKREFGVEQILRLISEIRELCINLGVEEREVSAPSIGAPVCLRTRDELAAFIKNKVRESIGDWLNARYVAARIWEKALENDYTANVLVATVVGASVEEEQSMSCFNVKHNLMLEDENEIDPAFISKMYEKFSKKNRKKND